MTEEKTFEPITDQETFDERIKARLARERERWEKEGGAEDLQAQLDAKDEELAAIKAQHAVDWDLTRRGITDETRQARIRKLIDVSGASGIEPTAQLEALSKEVPELFTVHVGAGSGGGSKKPVISPTEKPVTRGELENMSESEINSRWDRVKAFMGGER
jgi:hypothetical protein